MSEESQSQAGNGNPFRSSTGRRRRRDRTGASVFAFCTYFVLLCAAYIFVDIAGKGIPVLFQAEAPFVNLEFLTENPKSLVVFRDIGHPRRDLSGSAGDGALVRDRAGASAGHARGAAR
jgi:hypothetical protein